MNIAELDALDDSEAKATLEALGVDLFGPQWKTDFALATGTSRRTVQMWFERGNRPSNWAILLADAWAHNKQLSDAIRSFNFALAALGDATATL